MTMTILPDHIHRRHSDGRYSSSKTVCVTAVLTALGIPIDRFQSTSTAKNVDAYEGVIRRNGFALRSRKSAAGPRETVGGVRSKIAKFGDPVGTVYLIRVTAHVLLLDRDGKTIVDTDPRKRDRRTIGKIHAIWPK